MTIMSEPASGARFDAYGDSDKNHEGHEEHEGKAGGWAIFLRHLHVLHALHGENFCFFVNWPWYDVEKIGRQPKVAESSDS